MKKYCYFLLFLFVFLVPQVAHMQTDVEEQISVDFSSNFPGPNEVVAVRVESYLTDLDKAEISWLVDGQLVEQGTGLKEFGFETGNLGTETTLTIQIEKQGGGTLERTYYVNPGEVDLYYEAETYTPPFYKGRSDFSLHSGLKIVAIPNLVAPNGQQISKDQITYEWTINGRADAFASGVGKNVYNYSSEIIPEPIDVTVKAESTNTNNAAKITKTIEPISPSISVYEKNPIYGTIFSQTIKDDFILNREEIEIIAVPYDFSTDISEQGIFSWKVDGEEISDFDSNEITFRKTGGGESTNRVSIQIEHPDNFFQNNRHLFNLNFGNTNREFDF